PEGYLTPCGDTTYGEALLAPSAIYASFVAKLQEAGIPLHYAVHVTGHGWRKLMRLDLPLVYRIERLPPVLPVFDFIAAHASMDADAMYGTFNMGVGCAVYVPAGHAAETVRIAHAAGHAAWDAGTVRDEGGRKAVEIVPNGVTFGGDSL